MDFGELLKTTWGLYIKAIVRLVLFTLLGVALCMAVALNSIGSAFSGLGTLLTGPFGFLLMALAYERTASPAAVQTAAE